MFAFIFMLAQVASDSVLTLDIQVLNFAAGLVVPLLVGLLAKLEAPSGLKAILNLALSAIAGAITTAIQADGSIVLNEWLTGIGMTWVTSIVSYYGLWKPTSAAPAVQQATRGFGIGGPPIIGDDGKKIRVRRRNRPLRAKKK